MFFHWCPRKTQQNRCFCTGSRAKHTKTNVFSRVPMQNITKPMLFHMFPRKTLHNACVAGRFTSKLDIVDRMDPMDPPDPMGLRTLLTLWTYGPYGLCGPYGPGGPCGPRGPCGPCGPFLHISTQFLFTAELSSILRAHTDVSCACR